MSVKFASRANTAKQEEDPHVQFFRGELKTALDKGDLYMERIGSKRQRPVDVEDLDPEERSRFALVVFEDVIKALQVQRTCFYCAQKYSEGASLGRYQCAWHPGTYQQGAWSCCGDAFDHTARTRKAPNGCSYCDHNDRPYDSAEINMREIAYEVVLYFSIPKTATRTIFTNSQQRYGTTCVIQTALTERLPRAKRYRPMEGAPMIHTSRSLLSITRSIGISSS